ncbi:hypothetical protein K7X08_023096 [Anisodus acutangulus]|uniref:Uncharacterized protein n=1 Tax=Anisodus acutangulus TaxID=402998 RepID=A0A9Q1RH21_9SOLA|nr:hypothetical protein K7X08_023096 [Anisodus acutangulus]
MGLALCKKAKVPRRNIAEWVDFDLSFNPLKVKGHGTAVQSKKKMVDVDIGVDVSQEERVSGTAPTWPVGTFEMLGSHMEEMNGLILGLLRLPTEAGQSSVTTSFYTKE